MEFRYYECSCQGQGLLLVGKQVYIVYSQMEAFGVLERFGNSPVIDSSSSQRILGVRELQVALSTRCNLPETEGDVVFGESVNSEHMFLHRDLEEKLALFQARCVEV